MAGCSGACSGHDWRVPRRPASASRPAVGLPAGASRVFQLRDDGVCMASGAAEAGGQHVVWPRERAGARPDPVGSRPCLRSTGLPARPGARRASRDRTELTAGPRDRRG